MRGKRTATPVRKALGLVCAVSLVAGALAGCAGSKSATAGAQEVKTVAVEKEGGEGKPWYHVKRGVLGYTVDALGEILAFPFRAVAWVIKAIL
jgi:hypothetical protein